MYFEEFWALPRMGFSRATHIPYNVDHLDSRSVISSARIRDDFSLQTPCPTPLSFGIHVDFDLFVSNVENQIMDDQLKDKGQVVFSPRDLLMKSNPAMFNDVKDFTNPREWYHSLQHEKRMQRSSTLASSATATSKIGPVQTLKRTNSMADLSSAGANMQKKQFFQSQHNLYGTTVTAGTSSNLKKASFSLENLRYVPEENKENEKPINLPLIKTDAYARPAKEHEHGQVYEGQKDSLPKLTIKQNNSQQSAVVSHTNSEDNTTKSVKFDPIDSKTQKMEKWISEVTDDKNSKDEDDMLLLGTNNDKTQQKPKIMKENPTFKRTKLPVLKPMQIFPNRFMELRIDKGTNINRGRYKLKQKSLYHLKSLENEQKDNLEKRSNEDCESRHFPEHIEKFYIKERRTTILEDFAKSHHMKPYTVTLDDIAKARQERGDGLTKLNLDQFAVEAYDMHPHSKFAFAKMQQTTTSDLLKLDIPVHLQPYSMHHQEGNELPKLRREGTKASIVNLTIDKNSFAGRSPTFVRKSQTVISDIGSTPSTGFRRKDESSIKINDDRKEESPQTNSKYVQGKGSKVVMSKFKHLKVFPEIENESSSNEDGIDGQNSKQAVYKLDLKHYVKPDETSDIKTNENGIAPDPNVDFQFGSGEVIITRQSSTAGSSNLAPNLNGTPLSREKSKISLKDISAEKGITEEVKCDNGATFTTGQENVQNTARSTSEREKSAKSNGTVNTDKNPSSMSPQNQSPVKNVPYEEWPEKEKTILDIKLPEKAYDSEVTTSPINMSPPPPPNTEIITESPTKIPEKNETDMDLPNETTKEEDEDVVDDHSKDQENNTENNQNQMRKDVSTSMTSLLDEDGRGPDGRQPPS